MHKILGNVQFERGFHFSTEEGYTGITATSLADFAQKLETIDLNSVLFHYPRGDFQRWIDDTLGDKELANKMCFIRRGISGERLRKQLVEMVRNRIRELEPLLQTAS
ncbi:MAG: DUF5752 family protein [Candidatus Bathyarchaeia archaeon]|jgi:hypothetical protein